MLIFILGGVFVLLLIAAVVRARTASSTRSRLTIRWSDAWLKSLVIFVGIGLFVVLVPAKVMELDAVTGLDRIVQDLIGIAVWGVGLLGALAALAWAQSKEQI